MKNKTLSLLILFFLALFLASCHTPSSLEKSMKKIDARKEEKAKAVQAQYDRALNQHMKNQSKETRKQMKKHKKDAGEGRRKLFGKKQRINCAH